jgi:hypothetical protein
MDVITCKQQEKVWKQILGNTKIMVSDPHNPHLILTQSS